MELGLTEMQSIDRLADHFSAISNTVEPLDIGQFPHTVRQAVEDGRNSDQKPVLTQQQVYLMLRKVKKPTYLSKGMTQEK